MTSNEVRQKFLDFFEEKGHTIIPSASLIPNELDPTTLFIESGMQPLMPYLLGEKHPQGKKLANAQKCIRTIDIEEVGDASHLTFFEMLGNWSLGDPDAQDGIGAGYFKKEAIEWSWEFLTDKKWLSLDKDKIAVSVFKGDENAPFDEESFGLWKKIGISEKRIAKLGRKDNWWAPGETGPCGPDTEIFYWMEKEEAPEVFDSKDSKWVEFWNNVFMEYKSDGVKVEKLPQKNVDTGMGIERLVMIMQKKDNVYETDLFAPIMALAENNRIVADHLKASVFLLAEGVIPSNTDKGYVLRRLIRRAVKHKKNTKDITLAIIEIYKNFYPELKKNKEKILNELMKEENNFRKTLGRGLKEFEKISNKNISGHSAFVLFSTYGFPIEMTRELAQEKGITVDLDGFKKEFEKHQELSRTAGAGMFKGGLAEANEETTKLHTTTHLLLAALRKVLGKHVVQKGSNITSERLRLDFSHPEKLTDEQKQKVENLVNEKIRENLSIQCEEMGPQEAKEKGALGVFEHKYSEKVKVYGIRGNSDARSEPPFSREICGGPHVEKTGELGEFKILKEEASSVGVRRIKAVLK